MGVWLYASCAHVGRALVTYIQASVALECAVANEVVESN